MKRLMYDHGYGAEAVTVRCYKCHALRRMVDTIIDLDGPPFQAYYCQGCAPVGRIEPCTRDGCQRWHREEDHQTDR